jgi:hypothetical protein
VPLFNSEIHGYSAAPVERTFFFEKKNQKTFSHGSATPATRTQVSKVFCFFFSRKKFFLALLSAA